jgi:hypothetical protein
MGYPQPPAAPSRPSTVTAAGFAMYALAFLQIASVPLAIAVVGPTKDAMREALGTSSEADAMVTATNIGVYIGIALALAFTVGWVVLALLDLRGKQVARIITWVLSGLFLCCVGFSLLGSAASLGGGGSGTINGVSQADLRQRVLDAQPSYYRPLSLVSYALEAVLVLAVIILLALPASNAFFRKRPADVWEPPLPGTPYSPS